MTAPFNKERADPAKVLNALAQPLITVDGQGMVIDANVAAETFFAMGRGVLLRSRLTDLLPFGSPVLVLVDEATHQPRDRRGLQDRHFHAAGRATAALSMFSSLLCRSRATLSQLCCKNGQLPKK